jgi:hypothetical protein
MYRWVRVEDCQPRPLLALDALFDLYSKLHLPRIVSFQDCQVPLRLQVCSKLFKLCRTFLLGLYFRVPIRLTGQTDRQILPSFSRHFTSHLEYGSILAFCRYLWFPAWAVTLRNGDKSKGFKKLYNNDFEGHEIWRPDSHLLG